MQDENALVRRNGRDLLLRVLRMDGEMYRTAELKDKQMLLEAAAGVVLQRDISLSRRVYTWLIGTAETSEEQIAYFEENGLSLLIESLTVEMEGGQQRPYRLFLALLDKHEIGAMLVDRQVLPCLRVIKNAAEQNPEVGSF